jgi:hypothetical protein
MKSETDAFLDRVRDAELPTAADEARVQRALHAAVAAGVLASVSVPSLSVAGRLGQALAKAAGFGAKPALFVACATAALFAARQELVVATPRPSAQPGELPAALPPPRALATAGAPPAPAKSAARPRPAARQSALRSELDLLERVQAALKRGDGSAALRELDAHITSDRMLLAERQAARVLSLCQLGRVAEARQAAARFAAQHPDSVQRELIAGSCANR